MQKFINKVFYVILCYLTLASNAYAANKKIYSLTELEPYLNHLKKDTLVIFDVDHVLIMSTDNYTRNRHPYRQILWDELTGKISEQEAKLLQSIIMLNSKYCLVDQKIINLLQKLKNSSIPTVALTFYPTGELGVIKNLIDFRVKGLQNVGIDFTKLSPFKGTTLIHKLKNKNGTPTIKNGIIFTAKLNKDLTLEHVLKNKNYYPKSIIFIDDKLEHLTAVETLCNKLNIAFYGFHYVAVEQRPLPIINKKKEKMRFEILKTQHKWLSVSELYKFKTDCQ